MSDESVGPASDATDGAEVAPSVDGEAAPSVVQTESPPAVADGGDASLLALIDRLTAVLERSDLTELEVESGGTGLLLRKPLALERAMSVAEPLSIVPGNAGP